MPPAMARPKGGVNIERATHIDKDGWYINGANVAAVFHSGTGEIRMSGKDIDRLAAYEETGLEPEDFKRAFNEAAVLKLAGQALGITPDRLRELAQADKEGRCVVLPCKIGDIVYEIRYTAENNSPRKHARKIFDCSVSVCTWRMREQPDMCYVSEKKCTKSDFAFMGRTVFLTREEAEAALRREQDAN